MNWNYELIYKTKDEYQKDLDYLLAKAKEIASLKGKLSDKENFKKSLLMTTELEVKLENLAVYTNLQYAKDSKDLANQELYSNTYKVFNEAFTILSFLDPEYISLGKDKVFSYLKELGLDTYNYYFDKLFKGESHVLEDKIEHILSDHSSSLRIFNRLHDILAVSDNESVDVVISDGTKLSVNAANFRLYLESLDNQDDRRLVFEAIFKFYAKHKETFAAIYEGIMRSEYANMKTRNYNSILESHLDINDISKDVFLTLIKTTRENTAPIKKYYELRRKYFGLDKIHTYDRFLNIVKDDTKYSYEEAKELFFDAVKEMGMGSEFLDKAHKVLEEGRVDVYPRDGKRTGAFSTSTYEKGTFIMLNHTDTLDSVFTLAHEAGHSIHSMYSNEYEPYELSNYVIFVAEIASTFNESLLLDYLMSKDIDKNTKIALLQKEIDNILSTFYRQSLFANFEYEAHLLVEEGKPVNASSLSKIMKDLYYDYYGIDLNDEPYKEYVWAYIPHLFNTPYYVYQYATSYAASGAIYQKVKNHEPEALENYFNLLKAGGSDYPVNLVKKAGIDLTKKESFMAVVDRLEELVDELEKLLG